MSESVSVIVSPDVIQARLQEETDITIKIQRVVEAINLVLNQIGSSDDSAIIRNIVGSLISQDEIFDHLHRMYEEIYNIWQRFRVIITRSDLNSSEKEYIRSRASQIVEDRIFQLQREVFFKIVNAREVAEGERNEDGPALLFPAVETLKDQILKNLRAQTDMLRPAAVDICKTFKGISERYARSENPKPGEKLNYDTIAQVYEQEKALFQEINAGITAAKLSDREYLDALIKRFLALGKSYRLKIISLKDKKDAGVTSFVEKIDLLKEGNDQSFRCLRPLNVLKNLVERFPKLEKQLDFFAESQYQARAVMQFLQEVNEEMSLVFQQYTLQSFTVVGLLHYKLNGTSHMYESIYFYFAVVQIEKDIREALAGRYDDLQDAEREQQLARDSSVTGIGDIVMLIHRMIAAMNAANARIHQAFLQYRSDQDLDALKKLLKEQTRLINAHRQKVLDNYKEAQRLFLDFLLEDLGATDLISQFNLFLKSAKAYDHAALIRKSFNKLMAAKSRKQEALEEKLMKQFDGRLEPGKIAAMAVLKIRKDFQQELLKEIQQVERAQDIYIHILKEFIKIQEDQDSTHASDNSIIRLVQRNFTNEFEAFNAGDARLFKRILHTPHLSDRDNAIAFLASNITPQEIESFSRLLPGLPRNELQLDSPFGRFLLDVKTMFKERLQAKGGSGEHITEKQYEKRERMKLVNNIALFLKESTEPFLKKIDTEELRINSLISLQCRKYQKELNEVIKYWQFLVQKQVSPGKGVRGRFRSYSSEEKQMMMKYISPEQLNQIERQLEASYDLAADPNLFEVESFLMEIAEGLFKNFEQDLRIKTAFESYEKKKKIRQVQFRDQDRQNILESEHFVPNIRNCKARVVKVRHRHQIARFIEYWDYLIDQQVPSSEKRKLQKAPAVEIASDSNNAVHYIADHQLQQIWQNLDRIETIRDESVRKSLIDAGMPVLQIARQCLNLFKEGQQKLVMKEVDTKRQEKMKQICNNTEFDKQVNTAIQSVSDN